MSKNYGKEITTIISQHQEILDQVEKSSVKNNRSSKIILKLSIARIEEMIKSGLTITDIHGFYLSKGFTTWSYEYFRSRVRILIEQRKTKQSTQLHTEREAKPPKEESTEVSAHKSKTIVVTPNVTVRSGIDPMRTPKEMEELLQRQKDEREEKRRQRELERNDQ